MRRLLLIVTALTTVAVPASVATVTLAAPAGAASGLTCGKLSGSYTATVTFKKCIVPKADKKLDKSLAGDGSVLVGGGALTWSPSGDTTIVGTPTATSPGQGSCPNKWTEEDVTFTVTGGTSTLTQAGDTGVSRVCIDLKNFKIKLVKGTVATF